MDSKEIHIGQAAQLLGITPKNLRLLERGGRIPPPRRDFNGRIYTEFDLALLRRMGVGQRPRKLKRAEEVLGGSR
jgi:DNA-binding transcriptional MerR regulator